MRGGSATSNPYLLASAVLAAGLLGLEAEKPLREQGRETTSEDNPDLTPFPQSLPLALDALEADDGMRAILGEEFVEVFTAVKRFELARFAAHVTDWETSEYLELY